MNDQEFAYLKKIRLLAHIDLDDYKSTQMRRRLDGFVASQPQDLASYCNALGRDPETLQKLRRFLTINVSEFFRDRVQFAFLEASVLPELLRRSPVLKIWSAGCSHGAEPYSLAILLEELKPGRDHRILATDIDGSVLAHARGGGPYTPSDVKNVDRLLLRKYFTRVGENYWLGAKIKDKVCFAQHNLLSDHFETSFDLVVCRNVIIYFTDEAKSRLMQAFWRSLKDDGVLFLGATEVLMSNSNAGFSRLSNSIYRKSGRVGVLAVA